jgi:hypothetical protein
LRFGIPQSLLVSQSDFVDELSLARVQLDGIESNRAPECLIFPREFVFGYACPIELNQCLIAAFISKWETTSFYIKVTTNCNYRPIMLNAVRNVDLTLLRNVGISGGLHE